MPNFRTFRVDGSYITQFFKNVRSHYKQPNHLFIRNSGPRPQIGGPPGFNGPPPGHSGRGGNPPPNRNPPGPRKFPELLYFPKFFRWLSMKIKLKYLQKAWDPDFTEGAFIYGSTHAICRISQIIHFEKPTELKGLLTEPAEKQLQADMLGKLTRLQKKVLLLKPEDIKLLVPIKVKLLKHKPDQKQCLIMLKSLSMKWYHENQNVKLVLIVIDTEFTRDYIGSTKSEWFISLFKIVQCALINGSATPPKPTTP